MTPARVLVTLVFFAAVYTLGRVSGCSASRPYGYPGERLAAARVALDDLLEADHAGGGAACAARAAAW